MKGQNLSLDEVREITVNNSLVVASVLGTFSYIFSLLSFLKTGFNYLFVRVFLFIEYGVVITINRSRLSAITEHLTFIYFLTWLSLSERNITERLNLNRTGAGRKWV